MTLEQRIEAAAKELSKYMHTYAVKGEEGEPASSLPLARNFAELALRTAYPELHASPPRAWLAPWEASEEMLSAAEDSIYADDYHYAAPRHQWPAMRDAHLAQGSGE